VKTIYLIRHAQTAWNADGRWQGSIDIPLDEFGHQQAQALASHLAARPVGSVYSSDLLRARQTAEPVAAALGLAVQTDPRLREMNLGIFEGLTRSEILQRYPQELRSLSEDYMGFVVPKGESRQMMQDRAHEALSEIACIGIGPHIVVVTHGGTIRTLLLKHAPAPQIAAVKFHNTSITTLRYDDGRWSLVELASTMHLEAGSQFSTGDL